MKMFAILCSLFLAAGQVIASSVDSSYDYSASVECLPEPMSPQYDGGLFANPSFDAGLGDWFVHGKGKIMARKSPSGNSYMVAYNRSVIYDSFAHDIYLQKGLLYTFSAWMQINSGKEIITAYIGTPTNFEQIVVGSVIAQSGCWSMLKGGFTVDEDMKAGLYFVSKNTAVELWLDNVSLKPFTRTEWQEQQKTSISNIRKREVIVHVTTQDGIKLQGANITLNQIRPQFMLGCSSTGAILDNTDYQNWFLKRFPATSFSNEMKWYYTESKQGQENYTVPDAMVNFFKKNRVSIRGHTIHWAFVNATPYWVKELSPREILNNAIRRTGSIVSRYLGDVTGWDVMNENMHNSYFEDKLGNPHASAMFYQIVHAITPETPLFLNEYNTLEYPADLKSIPWKYVEKIREIRAFPGNENLNIKIGLQGHFLLKPNISYVRASFDILGATKMPIWLTELDTRRGPHQAEELEDVIREAYSHPAVEGIIVWGPWKPETCNQTCISNETTSGVLPQGCTIDMCLVDNNFNNTPVGDMVDRLIREWRTRDVKGSTDKEGVYQHKVFHGEYSLQYSHPLVGNGGEKKFNVTSDDGSGPLEIFVTL